MFGISIKLLPRPKCCFEQALEFSIYSHISMLSYQNPLCHAPSRRNVQSVLRKSDSAETEVRELKGIELLS